MTLVNVAYDKDGHQLEESEKRTNLWAWKVPHNTGITMVPVRKDEDGTITVQESWWPSADGSHQIHQLTDGTMWNENGQRCDAQGNPIA